MRIFLAATTVFVLLVGTAAAWAAAPPVQMEVCTGDQMSPTAQQDWVRNLSRAGVGNLQFRAVQPDDQPKIQNRGTAERPNYLVTAMLLPNGELVVPGARFRPGEAGRLAGWLAEVARVGPTLGEKKGAFGLAVSQVAQAGKELTLSVGGVTKDRSRREVVEQIQGRLLTPLRISPEQLQALGDEKVPAELGSFSCGTSLAYVLRSAGLGMVPAAMNGGKLEYRVVTAQRGDEVWPIGEAAPTPLRNTLPTLFEFHSINVQGVPLSTVLKAVEERLQAPILLDQIALAHFKIDPDEVMVNFPQGKTAYNLLLHKVLGPAKLKYEIRIDEAGKPFVWITSAMPLK